jgi:hypothetical protein
MPKIDQKIAMATKGVHALQFVKRSYSAYVCTYIGT